MDKPSLDWRTGNGLAEINANIQKLMLSINRPLYFFLGSLQFTINTTTIILCTFVISVITTIRIG